MTDELSDYRQLDQALLALSDETALIEQLDGFMPVCRSCRSART